jgi:hypothetical protein
MSDEIVKEKFSLTTFLFGKSGIKTWWETGGILARILMILAIVAVLFFSIRFIFGFFNRTNQNISKQKITVEAGGHLDNFTIQTTVRDRPTARVYLFAETSAGSHTTKNTNFDENADFGARIGVRGEYDIFDWFKNESKVKQEIKQEVKNAVSTSNAIDETSLIGAVTAANSINQ